MSGLLQKAVDYLDSFWKQIMVYWNSGRYSIDNNSDKMANISVVCHTLISTCKLIKVSVSEYFSKVFAKIVRRCTDYSSILPMNMGLSVSKY